MSTIDHECSDLRTEVINLSLDEIQRNGTSSSDGEPCVICLETVQEQAVAQPCGHKNFDYLCLLSWLERQKACPLCKADVKSIAYHDQEGKSRTFVVPDDDLARKSSKAGSPRSQITSVQQRRYQRRANERRLPRYNTDRRRPLPDEALSRRRDVYRKRLYSRHVGANRISAYTNLTPQDFRDKPELISRARSWIRRELEVFSFLQQPSIHQPRPSSTTDAPSAASSRSNNPNLHLNPNTPSSSTNPPSSHSPSSPSAPPQTLRTIGNASFLLEYIIAILKTVDVRDSSGHAEDMIADFLGREDARLFLHELNSFLRSPYESVEAWDLNVQYPVLGPVSDAGHGADARHARRAADGGDSVDGERTRGGASVRDGRSEEGPMRRKRDRDVGETLGGREEYGRRNRVARGSERLGGNHVYKRRYLDRYVPD